MLFKIAQSTVYIPAAAGRYDRFSSESLVHSGVELINIQAMECGGPSSPFQTAKNRGTALLFPGGLVLGCLTRKYPVK